MMTTAESVAEAAKQADEEIDERHKLVETIVAEVIKSLKSLKLYDAGNRIAQTRLDQLEGCLRPFLAEEGELTLYILPFELQWNGKTVHRNKVRESSLPFRLYSEGLRSMTLVDEITRDGLVDLLDVFNTDFSRDEMAEDDIVTILWERNIPGVSYELTEETVTEGTGRTLGEFLGTGSDDHEQKEMPGDPGAEPVELPDSSELDRPDALPTESVNLTAEETEILQAQLVADAARDLLLEVPSIMIETVHASPYDAEETERLIEVLSRMIDSMLATAPPHRTLALLSRTFELTDDVFADSELVRPLTDGLVRHVSTVESTKALGGLAEALPPGTIPELRAILDRLPIKAAPALAKAAADARRASVRRLFLEVVAKHGDSSIDVLAGLIDDARGPVAIDLLATIGVMRSPAAVPSVRKAIGHPEPLVRRNAIKILIQRAPEGACALFLESLEDTDHRVRLAALTAISTIGGAQEAQILKRSIGVTSFEERPAEQRRILLLAFAGVAQVESVPTLSRILLQKGFFTRAARIVDGVSAAEALTKVNDPKAIAALEKGAKDGNKQVVEACRAQLARLERSRGR